MEEEPCSIMSVSRNILQVISRAKSLCFEEQARVMQWKEISCCTLIYRKDGSNFKRLVLRAKETERVFFECHLSAGGHRGRDATIGKIKERYYWPNYYKDIEQKVRLVSSSHQMVSYLVARMRHSTIAKK